MLNLFTNFFIYYANFINLTSYLKCCLYINKFLFMEEVVMDVLNINYCLNVLQQCRSIRLRVLEYFMI